MFLFQSHDLPRVSLPGELYSVPVPGSFTVNLLSPGVIWEESLALGTAGWPIDMSVDIVWIINWYKRILATVGGTIIRQVVLCCIWKLCSLESVNKSKNKPTSNLSLLFLLQVAVGAHVLTSLRDALWHGSVWWNKPFLPLSFPWKWYFSPQQDETRIVIFF